MAGNDQRQLREMLEPVAMALGDALLPYVAFVGGTTTALLITDPFTRETVRFTEDIDLIVKAESHAQWQKFQQQLRSSAERTWLSNDWLQTGKASHPLDWITSDWSRRD